MVIPRPAINPNAIPMRCNTLKTPPFVEGDCPEVFGINEEFKLRETIASCLFDHPPHQGLCRTRSLIVTRDEKGAYFAPMSNACQPFWAITTEPDKLFAGKYTSETISIQNCAAAINADRRGFLERHQKPHRVVTRPFYPQLLPCLSMIRGQCPIDEIFHWRLDMPNRFCLCLIEVFVSGRNLRQSAGRLSSHSIRATTAGGRAQLSFI